MGNLVELPSADDVATYPYGGLCANPFVAVGGAWCTQKCDAIAFGGALLSTMSSVTNQHPEITGLPTNRCPVGAQSFKNALCANMGDSALRGYAYSRRVIIATDEDGCPQLRKILVRNRTHESIYWGRYTNCCLIGTTVFKSSHEFYDLHVTIRLFLLINLSTIPVDMINEICSYLVHRKRKHDGEDFDFFGYYVYEGAWTEHTPKFLKSSLNGSNGSWTGTDDIKKGLSDAEKASLLNAKKFAAKSAKNQLLHSVNPNRGNQKGVSYGPKNFVKPNPPKKEVGKTPPVVKPTLTTNVKTNTDELNNSGKLKSVVEQTTVAPVDTECLNGFSTFEEWYSDIEFRMMALESDSVVTKNHVCGDIPGGDDDDEFRPFFGPLEEPEYVPEPMYVSPRTAMYADVNKMHHKFGPVPMPEFFDLEKKNLCLSVVRIPSTCPVPTTTYASWFFDKYVQLSTFLNPFSNCCIDDRVQELDFDTIPFEPVTATGESDDWANRAGFITSFEGETDIELEDMLVDMFSQTINVDTFTERRMHAVLREHSKHKVLGRLSDLVVCNIVLRACARIKIMIARGVSHSGGTAARVQVRQW